MPAALVLFGIVGAAAAYIEGKISPSLPAGLTMPGSGNQLPPAAGTDTTPTFWTVALYASVGLGLAYGVKKVFSK